MSQLRSVVPLASIPLASNRPFQNHTCPHSALISLARGRHRHVGCHLPPMAVQMPTLSRSVTPCALDNPYTTVCSCGGGRAASLPPLRSAPLARVAPTPCSTSCQTSCPHSQRRRTWMRAHSKPSCRCVSCCRCSSFSRRHHTTTCNTNCGTLWPNGSCQVFEPIMCAASTALLHKAGTCPINAPRVWP